MPHTVYMPRYTRPARPGLIRGLLSDALGLAALALLTAASCALLHDALTSPVLPV